MNNELKLSFLKLYRDILRAHRRNLTEDMRFFGDMFVKTEFHMNYQQAEDIQLKVFMNT